MTDQVFRRPHDYRTKPTQIFLLLAVASATSGTAALTLDATGTLRGAGALAGTCSIAFDASATAASAANLAGASAILIDALGIGGASGALAGATDIVFTPSATLGSDIAGAFQRTVRYAKWTREPYDHRAYADRLAIFPLNVSSGISGQADIGFTPTATLRGAGVLAGVSTTVLGAGADLGGTGRLVGSSAVVFTPTATLSGTASGAVTGTAALVLDGTAALRGTGSLLGVAATVFSASAQPRVAAAIAGTSSLIITVSGTLIDSASGAVHPLPPPQRIGHIRFISRIARFI